MAIAILDSGTAHFVNNEDVAEKLEAVTPLLFEILSGLHGFQLPVNNPVFLRKKKQAQLTKQHFSVPGRKITLFEHPLGFAFDVCGLLTVIRMPCSWLAFTENAAWNKAMQECLNCIAEVFMAKTIAYVPDSITGASGCLDLIYSYQKKPLSIQDIINYLKENGDGGYLISNRSPTPPFKLPI
jgi:hypothetical protein